MAIMEKKKNNKINGWGKKEIMFWEKWKTEST